MTAHPGELLCGLWTRKILRHWLSSFFPMCFSENNANNSRAIIFFGCLINSIRDTKKTFGCIFGFQELMRVAISTIIELFCFINNESWMSFCSFLQVFKTRCSLSLYSSHRRVGNSAATLSSLSSFCPFITAAMPFRNAVQSITLL